MSAEQYSENVIESCIININRELFEYMMARIYRFSHKLLHPNIYFQLTIIKIYQLCEDKRKEKTFIYLFKQKSEVEIPKRIFQRFDKIKYIKL